MDNKKITIHQLYTITGMMSLGGSILVIASTIAAVAKQDSWIAALIAPAYGIIVILIYHFLGSRFKDLSLIGIVRRIFGKWLGFAVSLCYVLFFILISAHIPWYIGSFFGRMMHETPSYVIGLVAIIGIVIAAFYGLEAVARASEVFIMLVTVFFVISIILVLGNVNIHYATPVCWKNGIAPALKGSYILNCFISFSIINMLMIFPKHVEDIQKSKGALIKGYLWSGGISFVTIAVTILVLGSSLTSKSSFPTVMLASEINVLVIVTRVEYMVSLIWIMSQFMVGFVFFYSGATGLSELLGLRDHKKIILPLGLISLVYSGIDFPNTVYQGNWVNLAYIPLISTYGVILPVIMLIVYGFRKKLSGSL